MNISLTKTSNRKILEVAEALRDKEDGLYLFESSIGGSFFFIVKTLGVTKFGQYLTQQTHSTTPLRWEGSYVGKLALTLEEE